jgi:hypothetical protein
MGTREERKECHGNWRCCQHVDAPMCNSRNDPHFWARWRFRMVEYLHNHVR